MARPDASRTPMLAEHGRSSSSSHHYHDGDFYGAADLAASEESVARKANAERDKLRLQTLWSKLETVQNSVARLTIKHQLQRVEFAYKSATAAAPTLGRRQNEQFQAADTELTNMEKFMTTSAWTRPT